MNALRAVAATALAAAAACAIALASGAPVAIEPQPDAAIRFSWRASGQPVEQCRTPSPEEQAGLPVHMRRDRICERRLSAFRLVVELDGARALDERVVPEGAQQDRPAYVLHELRVAPGPHRISVRFASESGSQPERTLDASLVLAPREIALVTEAPHGLEIRRSGARSRGTRPAYTGMSNPSPNRAASWVTHTFLQDCWSRSISAW